jgi:hypothetical protein
VWNSIIHGLCSRDEERSGAGRAAGQGAPLRCAPRRGYTEWLRSAAAASVILALCLLLLVPAAYGAWFCVRPWHRFDSAAPAAFVLEQRQPDEPVVGCLWEQQYYCRGLCVHCRQLVRDTAAPPSLPAAVALGPDGRTGGTVRSLWIMTSTDLKNPQDYLSMLPAAPWRVAQTEQFRDITVFHVVRD